MKLGDIWPIPCRYIIIDNEENYLKKLKLKKRIDSSDLLERNDFSIQDFNDPPTRFFPGEWFIAETKNVDEAPLYFMGHANPFHSNGLSFKIIGEIAKDKMKGDFVWDYINNQIISCHKQKQRYKFFSQGGRLFHGAQDGLHGLVIDSYLNCCLVQISSAGIDFYREKIRDLLKDLCQKPIYFLDNTESRKKEGLPQHSEELRSDFLMVEENGFIYEIPFSKLQKTGFYYDHRSNRKKLENLLGTLNLEINSALDLFSYVGSWGLHAMRAGAKSLVAVDQSAIGESILSNALKNNLRQKIIFKKMDVFKYLDQCKAEGSQFDLIISDPPGFSKVESKKKEAMVGYKKLYNKIFPLLSEQSILVAASCTQQVSLLELDKIVNEVALHVNRKINILDIGPQSPDHTFSKIESRSAYIKCIFYYVV